MKKKSIALDCRMYGKSGIGRYIDSILAHIKHSDIKGYKFVLVDYNNQLDSYEADHNLVEIVNTDISPLSVKEAIIGWRFFSKLSKEVDLIHFMHFNIPFRVPTNSIITIHDIIPLRRSREFNPIKIIYIKNLLKSNVAVFKRIIAISEYTKDDLIDYFQIDENKIQLIYHQAHNLSGNADAEVGELGIDVNKYFLCVGNRKASKNVDRAVNVMDNVLSKHEDYKFIIIGRKYSSFDDVDQAIQKSKNKDKMIALTNVTDDQLGWYYRNCLALIFLSYYEGFGLPPLEGFAYGKPCVASNKTSIPEVVGNGGILVDPYNNTEIENAMLSMIEDKQLYAKLAENAVVRYRYFKEYDEFGETLRAYDKSLEI